MRESQSWAERLGKEGCFSIDGEVGSSEKRASDLIFFLLVAYWERANGAMIGDCFGRDEEGKRERSGTKSS